MRALAAALALSHLTAAAVAVAASATAAVIVTTTAVEAAAGRLVDVALAEVGGRLITLSDVALARALGLFELAPSDGPITAAELDRYVDAQLALGEAAQLDIEVSADDVARAWDAAGGDGLGARLTSVGVGPAWARRLIEADLRIERFVELRFRAFAFVTDAEVEQALGPGPHDQAARNAAREQLRAESAARALLTWREEARRRVPIRIIASDPPWPPPFSLSPGSRP
jgi:hypothetical protein